MVWRNNSGDWVNAVTGNHYTGGTPLTNVHKTYAQAFADNLNVSLPLGSWGVDTVSNTVWAVLDHNSDFAVIPEPSTLVLGGLALLGFAGVGLRRRRMAKQEA